MHLDLLLSTSPCSSAQDAFPLRCATVATEPPLAKPSKSAAAGPPSAKPSKSAVEATTTVQVMIPMMEVVVVQAQQVEMAHIWEDCRVQQLSGQGQH